MRMLMPSHAKNVKLYRDSQPVFTRYGIESQLDAMFTPTVQLKSGGYIVINQAEALVAIDVNSGRATREHSIEDTAVKTNSEAAEEIARQLRLRDLAGLIVIDFIDMDEGRNNRIVERRVKDALKHDRARIQVGRISHFGLLEMSRQRIRTSVLESSTEKCPICGGSGHVRSVSSVTLALLRALEETLLKGATHNQIVRTRAEVALYVLNQKRSHLRTLEERFRVTITVSADPSVVGTQAFVIDRGEQVHSAEAARELAASQPATLVPIDEEAFAEPVDEEPGEGPSEAEAAPSDSEQDGGHRRRRRRGGRGRSGRSRERGDAQPTQQAADDAGEHAHADDEAPSEHAAEAHGANESGHGDGEGQDGAQDGAQDGGRRRRRRGRRGGRRHRRNGENGGYHGEREDTGQNIGQAANQAASHDAEQAAVPSYGDDTTIEPPQFEPEPPPASSAAAFEPEPQSSDDAPAASEGSPRRGSTVREPASFSQPPADAPPSPVISSSGGEDAAPPRRGWWGRRLMGGDK
jgi:ribonuclease E